MFFRSPGFIRYCNKVLGWNQVTQLQDKNQKIFSNSDNPFLMSKFTFHSRSSYSKGPSPRKVNRTDSHRKDRKSRTKVAAGLVGASMLLAAYCKYAKQADTTEDSTTQASGNRSNRSFYNRIIPSGELEAYAHQAGLHTNPDVKVIVERLGLNFGSVLLSGAGYGRVPRCLVDEHGFDEKKLTLVEINPDGAQLLRERFPKAKVFQQDIMTLKERNHYDLICLLFSGITDFSKSEQLRLINLFLMALSNRGYLVIDLPLGTTNATDVEGNQHVIHLTKEVTYTGYLPSLNEFKEYFEQACKEQGLELDVISLAYSSANGRKRALVVASKSSIVLLPKSYEHEEPASRVIESRRFKP